MQQDFGSECSSECESGWTVYLGHSMYPCDSVQKSKNDEDEDMSMVSDASSGPPHVQEQERNNNGVNEASFRKKNQDFPGFRDDATISPFDFSYVDNDKASVGEGDNGIADYSEGGSRFIQDRFGHFKFSVSGSQLQQNQLRKP